MNRLLRKIYFLIPFKRELFLVLRLFFKPSQSLAGYLKFVGPFKLTFEGRELTIYNNNLTIPSLLFWRGLDGYEPETLKYWIKLSDKANVVFDVGANFGLFGLLTNAINKSSNVHCFEALQRNYDLIQQNARLNAFKMKTVQAAVSNQEGTSQFYDMASYDNTIGSFDKTFVLNHPHHKDLVLVEVATITLDDYSRRENIQALDLVKIDVEGHEIAVLEGAREILTKFKPDIIIEVSEANGERVAAMLQEMNPDYLFYAIKGTGRLELTETFHSHTGRNFLISKLAVES